MALYYDEQFTQAKCTNALDPNTEWFPFMSYKLLDWQQRIGVNQFVLKTYHPDWEQARDRDANPYTFTNTANIELQLEFYGDQNRAGYFASLGIDPPSYGFMFAGFSSDYIYFYDVRDYEEKYGLENSSDRGQNEYATAITRSSIRDFFTASVFNNPAKSFVIYSDEPGDEWFAWNVRESISDYCHGIFHKAKNINPEVPEAEDMGWLLSVSSATYNIGPSIQGDSSYNSSFRWQAYPSLNYGTFGTERVSWLNSMRVGQPVVSAYGLPMADTGDRVAWAANSSFVIGYSYEINGSEYVAISTSCAVKTS